MMWVACNSSGKGGLPAYLTYIPGIFTCLTYVLRIPPPQRQEMGTPSPL